MNVNSKEADAMLAEYAAFDELGRLPASASREHRIAKIKAWWEAKQRRCH
jgi:hypothetical protein